MSISIQDSARASCATHHATGAQCGSRRGASTAPEVAGAADSRRPQVRHGLAKALTDALADLMPDAGGNASASSAVVVETASAPPTARGEQTRALHDFTHEFFHALRPTAGEDGPGRHGRGFSWGRATLGDIAQRLETLAQKLGAATTTPTPAADSAPAAASAPVPAAEPAAETATVSTALPMAEPSALLRAFQALAGQAAGASAPSDGATSLAALLTRIAKALQGDSAVLATATGALVDVTA